MTYKELQSLFWEMTAQIVEAYVTDVHQFVRQSYPTEGQPDWRITDNIVFVNLAERADPYGQQYDSEYRTEEDTVRRYRARTRVWDVSFTAYGSDSYEMLNAIRDDVLTEPIHRFLSQHGVFLITDVPACRQVPELWAGKWWDRWDLILHFNEWHELPPEDVGRIDTVTLGGSASR